METKCSRRRRRLARVESRRLTLKMPVRRLIVRPLDLVHHGDEFRSLFRLEGHVHARLPRVWVDARLLPDFRGGRLRGDGTARGERLSDLESLPLAETGLRAEREDDVRHKPRVARSVTQLASRRMARNKQGGHPGTPMRQKPRRLRPAAVHEAGHAVVGFALGRRVALVRIGTEAVPQDHPQSAALRGSITGGETRFDPDLIPAMQRQHSAGSVAAETVLLGASSDDAGTADLRQGAIVANILGITQDHDGGARRVQQAEDTANSVVNELRLAIKQVAAALSEGQQTFDARTMDALLEEARRYPRKSPRRTRQARIGTTQPRPGAARRTACRNGDSSSSSIATTARTRSRRPLPTKISSPGLITTA